RILVHRRSNTQSLAKHKKLDKNVRRGLAAQGRNIGSLRSTFFTMASNTRRETLLVRRGRQSGRGGQRNRQAEGGSVGRCQAHPIRQKSVEKNWARRRAQFYVVTCVITRTILWVRHGLSDTRRRSSHQRSASRHPASGAYPPDGQCICYRRGIPSRTVPTTLRYRPD